MSKNATLAIINNVDPCLVKTGASRSGIAGILLQQQEGDWSKIPAVSCFSRKLKPAEENYTITELEGLAVVESVKTFRNFLSGRTFEIMVDHCALCVLNKKKPSSPKLVRWALVLSEFNFEIVYTKGSLHEDVDCLSRAPVDNPIDDLPWKCFHYHSSIS